MPICAATTAVAAPPTKRSTAASKISSATCAESVEAQLWNEKRIESPEPKPESSSEGELVGNDTGCEVTPSHDPGSAKCRHRTVLTMLVSANS